MVLGRLSDRGAIMATWVYRKSDMLWCLRGADDPAKIHTQPGQYGLLDVPGPTPHPRLERADPNAASKRRAATASEMAAYDDAVVIPREFIRALQATAAALWKARTGSFPNAAQKAQLQADFVTAWKALGS